MVSSQVPTLLQQPVLSFEQHPHCLMIPSLRLLQRPVIMLSLFRSGRGFIPTTTCRTATVTKGGALVGGAKGALSRSLLQGQHYNSGTAAWTFESRRTTLPATAPFASLYNAAGKGYLSSGARPKGIHGGGASGVTTGQGVGGRVRVSGTRRLSMTAQPEVVPRRPNVVNPAARTTSTTLEQMTNSQFSDLDVSKATHAAISDVLGYDKMTKVQEQSIPVCLSGVDVLAKAKTGTGKTLAFLIPAIERAAQDRNKGISALIVSPTRELAQQIAAEAEQLLSFHKMRLMCAVGGVNINRDLNQLARGSPDILVATPGRLLDLLENCKLGFEAKHLKTLVLDEADHLLEMGFRPAIEKILLNLPSKEKRQTILFSATMPADVRTIANFAMRPNFETIDCVGEETSTHENVPQAYSLVPLADMMPRLAAALAEEKKNPDHKVMVFFVAARVVQAYAELFNQMGYDVLETHSRKSQTYRTRVSEAFRNRKGVILFSSDVSARGLDYPDVTLVVQVGMPSDESQYIHRLGRTARAGKGGSGLLLLSEAEKGFLQEVKDLPLKEAERIDPGAMVDCRQHVAEKKHDVSEETVEKAYVAWMGYYNSNLRRLRWTKEALVLEANFWATQIWGLPTPPALTNQTIGRMGMKGVPGLVIDGGRARGGEGGGRGAGGGRGRGRGRGGSGSGRGGGGVEGNVNGGQQRAYSSGAENFVGSEGRGARFKGVPNNGRGRAGRGGGGGRGSKR